MKGEDIFCKEEIIKDSIYYKTEKTMVLYDIAPVLPGHSLVIPRRHVLDITELSNDELKDMFETFKKIKPALFKLYGDESKSYDMTTQVGEYSGMSVKHAHVHIIPRKKNDPYQSGGGAMHKGDSVYSAIEHSPRLSKDEHKKHVDALRRELNWSD